MKAMDNKLIPKVIKLDRDDGYRRLFSVKNYNAISIRSGQVILKENETIGEHNTEDTEEIIVILDGQGELTINRHEKLNFGKNSALYIPPNTIHDVKNTGTSLLKYVFIACPT